MITTKRYQNVGVRQLAEDGISMSLNVCNMCKSMIIWRVRLGQLITGHYSLSATLNGSITAVLVHATHFP
jgi:hypothetical protein